MRDKKKPEGIVVNGFVCVCLCLFVFVCVCLC